ncbi:MAG: glycosyl hydrolase 53 family protein [Cyclobacteriaceae bacterium]
MRKFLLFSFAALSLLSCGSKDSKSNTNGSDTTFFAKGADVSWLTQMEAAGLKFYNSQGTQQDCMQILKDKGINSIRLRAWVHPKAGWNNTTDVIAKAKRAKNLGMKVMIDFHYSDDWADPGKQYKPAAWASLNFDSLKSSLYYYTKGVMDTLKLNGITPDWVQIGNETNDGMLWEDGRASKSMPNFATLINAGYDAVKSVSSSTKVIVHLSNGFDNGLFHWMFDSLTSTTPKAKFDIIGMSLYPSYANQDWSVVDSQCLANMNDLVSRYNKPVMVVEVGMPVESPVTCKSFLIDIIAKTKSVNGGNGLGVFYWEPECYSNWQGYSLGAFDNSGKPTVAMDAFAN